MELERKYADFAAEKAIELIGIDSPSGFTEKAAEWVRNEFEALGFAARMTEKGGVIADSAEAARDFCSRHIQIRSVGWFAKSKETAGFA